MEISILTDVGQKRTNNQDYANLFVNRAGKTMIILADGMGGHRAGNMQSIWNKKISGSTNLVRTKNTRVWARR